ncbi:hypothetical protein BDV29DRAFT_184153 [Aspergillus leporis]|uniref:Uncharacterized protein n=1 Tax=Aspergillus leporis TaxID=41062 RepID=A0A5N5WJF6_9EURO|nr:hypothetical protein BDV29DRAFT_184153 [Aspergillus leporis]
MAQYKANDILRLLDLLCASAVIIFMMFSQPQISRVWGTYLRLRVCECRSAGTGSCKFAGSRPGRFASPFRVY